MKRIFFFIFIFFLTKPLLAQYPGPIMDSMKKYQQLIMNAKTEDEKIKLAMQLQKLVLGKSSIDTALLRNRPASKEDALKERDRQVAEINRQKQAIDTAHSRKDKYAAIQKLQARNDSIRTATKDAGKHPVIQPGLITLPNAGQFSIDPLAPTDTSIVQINCNYHKTVSNKNGTSKESFEQSSYTATMYRQNGIIIVKATNDKLPEYVMQNKVRTVAMVGHHDINGSAYSSTGRSEGRSDQSYGFSFYYNPAASQFIIGAGAGLTVTTTLEDGTQTVYSSASSFDATNDPARWNMPGSNEPAKADGRIANFVKTKQGFGISFRRSWSEPTTTENGMEEFSADLVLLPPRYEAFIEPADTIQYSKWLPQGPVLTSYPTLINGGRGNDLQLKVTLWDNQTNKPSVDSYKAVIKLNNVSNMPGYCMNFPYDDATADNKPDMRFDKADSAIYESWSQNRIGTRSGIGPQYVTVVSYDYGGIADVTADVITPEGISIKAHLRQKVRSDTLTLPKRTAGSFIADYWKQQEGATGKTDLADDEKIEGDDRYPGDGLTLYEEYRGFLEKRKHFRGSAEKKDMMICNKIGTERSQNGIDMCESVLNQYGNRVVMHSKFTEDEFGTKHDPDADELKKMRVRAVHTPMKYDRCINYNNVEDLHLVDQHGVVLMFADTAMGYAEAVTKGKLDLGPPKNYYFLVITRDFNPKPRGWSETNGSIDSAGNIHTGEGGAKILTDEYGITVAHEILHCFHIRHHGDDNDYGQCTFRYLFMSGRWAFDKSDGKPYLENGSAIRVSLHWEDDPTHEIEATDRAVYARAWHIYGANSTHSGVEDCIMRYDIARGYIKDGNNVYLVRAAHYAELSGINLCNSTIGTGVNKRSHVPMSRYGDAAPGRGDCIHQFCVSDKYD
jgi:hypothetical protein